jgi:high-affinity nickel permease
VHSGTSWRILRQERPNLTAIALWPSGAPACTAASYAARTASRTLLGFIALMHVVAFGLLFGVIGPANYKPGTSVFGIGLKITAYIYGLRHAFDAHYIVAIDNTTRKLRGDGKQPKSVGFWFAMGHSTIVAGWPHWSRPTRTSSAR